MDTVVKSDKKFVRRLSKLKILSRIVIEKDIKIGRNVILPVDCQVHTSQQKEFLAKGEIPRLISIVEEWTLETAGFLNEKFGTKVDVSVNEHFVFDPTAYALTYWPEDRPSYEIALSTPTLASLYTPASEINGMNDVALFLKSILVHELAHCFGSMKHDKAFRTMFSSICRLLGIKPII